jgi:DNA ligase (NAD+)
MKKEEAEEKIAELRKKIRHHDHLYYVKASPTIADAAYDKLRSELEELETQFPDLKAPDSPTQRVGAPPLPELTTVEHLKPMLSLDSSTEEEQVHQFDERVKKLLEQVRLFDERVERMLKSDGVKYTAEPKFDGLSLELIYRHGILSQGSTRGNGIEGEEITPNIRTIGAVPLKLRDPIPPALVSIRGEALMPLDGFQQLNRSLTEKGKEAFANPRNAAAGSLRQLDSSITARRPLTFFAYEIMSMEGNNQPEEHYQELELLEKWGFRVDSHRCLCDGVEEAIDFHRELAAERDDLPFEIDGVVIQVNSIELREKLGVKTRSPRWAFALKFEPRREVTTVEDIVVQVGRTGKLTPVALLKPVDVGGVTVSRATLHNAGEVKKKDIRKGDRVRVERAGDVIPAVVERVGSTSVRRGKRFSMPDKCPVCGAPVDLEGAYHICTGGLSCEAQLKRGIEHFVSRGALDIDGLGTKTVDRFVDIGLLKNVTDIFKLKSEDLINLEGFERKSVDNLLKAIQEKKNVELPRFIYALGIRNVGEHVAGLLSKHFGTLEAIMEASPEELEEIEGIGPEVARSIYMFFSEHNNFSTISELLKQGISISTEKSEQEDKPLEGKKFVLTGSLRNFTRREASELIEKMGGRTTSSVSSETDYLVSGENPGSKLDRARELGVTILDEDDFIKLTRS